MGQPQALDYSITSNDSVGITKNPQNSADPCSTTMSESVRYNLWQHTQGVKSEWRHPAPNAQLPLRQSPGMPPWRYSKVARKQKERMKGCQMSLPCVWLTYRNNETSKQVRFAADTISCHHHSHLFLRNDGERHVHAACRNKCRAACGGCLPTASEFATTNSTGQA